MARAKARRPRRRNPGAGPSRGRVAHTGTTGSTRSFEERYPNLAARRRGDRLEHVRRARALGATRKQPSRHADLEVGGH